MLKGSWFIQDGGANDPRDGKLFWSRRRKITVTCLFYVPWSYKHLVQEHRARSHTNMIQKLWHPQLPHYLPHQLHNLLRKTFQDFNFYYIFSKDDDMGWLHNMILVYNKLLYWGIPMFVHDTIFVCNLMLKNSIYILVSKSHKSK